MLEAVLSDRCKLHKALPVLVGVSGGPDSLCLLDILYRTGYRPVVAYFNHRLRSESDRESAYVAELSRRLGLPFIADAADVAMHAKDNHLSIEESARILRYRFLFSAARLHQAQAVAVGHTADDQVETVLMHFLRGAGLSGLKGMEYRTLLPVFDPEIPIVRPLLSLWRGDTEIYCKENGLEPHYDASNLDQAYFRNKLRHVLIPELEKYNPRFKNAMIRTADVLQEDHASLQGIVDGVWKVVVVGSGPGWIAFTRHGLADTTRGIRRSLIRKAGELLCPERRDFGFEALDRAATFIESGGGNKSDFINSLYLSAEEGKIFLATYEAVLPFAQWPQVDQPVDIIGQQMELENGWVLVVEYISPEKAGLFPIICPSESHKEDPWSVWLDADVAAGKLTIRPKRAGDRFVPLGLKSGSVKLQDFFVNEKLPKRARAKWPLLCIEDEVAWVAGYRISERFRVTKKTKWAIHFTLRRN